MTRSILSGLFLFVLGTLVSWAFFSSMADTQAEREAAILAACDAPLRADIHGCRTGNSCDLDGARFLKTAGRGR